AVAHEHMVDLAVRPVRGPGPAADRAAPTGKQRAHRRAPQVEVTDDYGAPVPRRKLASQFPELHRWGVRKLRAEMYRHEVELEAAHVEPQVLRAALRSRIRRSPAERQIGNEPSGRSGDDGYADASVPRPAPLRDVMRPRLHHSPPAPRRV